MAIGRYEALIDLTYTFGGTARKLPGLSECF